VTPRSVRKLHRAVSDDIGDLRTQRPLPNGELDHLDPFLFLNHHGPQLYPPRNHGLPFGPHPHRGFETVTFIVDGSLLHRYTGGHESIIYGGGVQWMTAGRGLEHAELSPEEFRKRGGPLEILQLWVNLPARLKMTDPRYVGLQREEIPSIEIEGGTINAISGEWNGMKGPIPSLTGIAMATVDVRSRVTLPAPKGRTVFLYVVRGKDAFHLVEMNDDGDSVVIDGPAFVIYGHGEPYREPVVARGPFVMNTQEEIDEAIRDYEAGKF
jgi:redox-sensitive bicupin YhaK (pirin superfamily)